MIRRPRNARLIAALVVGWAVWTAPMPAAAHTDLDYTLPTDGAAIGEPLTEIAVAFTEEVTLVGPGFEVRSPQGEIVLPFAVTDDDRVFRLQIDPPMGGGDVDVRYEVAAADGHVISGGFSFTVSVDAPAPTVPPATVPSATVPSETVPPETVPSETVPPETAPPIAEPVATMAATTTVLAAQPANPDVRGAAGDRGDPGAGDGGGSMLIFVAVAAALALGGGTLGLTRRRTRS